MSDPAAKRRRVGGHAPNGDLEGPVCGDSDLLLQIPDGLSALLGLEAEEAEEATADASRVRHVPHMEGVGSEG